MINLSKSYHLSRIHFVIVIIIIALLVGMFLRFFATIQATIEQVSVDVSFLNFQQMVRYHNMLSDSEDKTCKFLDNPDLFKGSGVDGLDTSVEPTNIPGGWIYNSKDHTLSYTVLSDTYFRSTPPQRIIFDLYCKKGSVGFKGNDYQWCRDKRIWGCQNW